MKQKNAVFLHPDLIFLIKSITSILVIYFTFRFWPLCFHGYVILRIWILLCFFCILKPIANDIGIKEYCIEVDSSLWSIESFVLIAIKFLTTLSVWISKINYIPRNHMTDYLLYRRLTTMTPTIKAIQNTTIPTISPILTPPLCTACCLSAAMVVIVVIVVFVVVVVTMKKYSKWCHGCSPWM